MYNIIYIFFSSGTNVGIYIFEEMVHSTETINYHLDNDNIQMR